MKKSNELNENTIDAIDMVNSGENFSAEDITKIQEQMLNLGMLGVQPKTNGGNKKRMSAKKAKSRRKMARDSRRTNRPNK